MKSILNEKSWIKKYKLEKKGYKFIFPLIQVTSNDVSHHKIEENQGIYQMCMFRHRLQRYRHFNKSAVHHSSLSLKSPCDIGDPPSRASVVS